MVRIWPIVFLLAFALLSPGAVSAQNSETRVANPANLELANSMIAEFDRSVPTSSDPFASLVKNLFDAQFKCNRGAFEKAKAALLERLDLSIASARAQSDRAVFNSPWDNLLAGLVKFRDFVVSLEYSECQARPNVNQARAIDSFRDLLGVSSATCGPGGCPEGSDISGYDWSSWPELGMKFENLLVYQRICDEQGFKKHKADLQLWLASFAVANIAAPSPHGRQAGQALDALKGIEFVPCDKKKPQVATTQPPAGSAQTQGAGTAGGATQDGTATGSDGKPQSQGQTPGDDAPLPGLDDDKTEQKKTQEGDISSDQADQQACLDKYKNRLSAVQDWSQTNPTTSDQNEALKAFATTLSGNDPEKVAHECPDICNCKIYEERIAELEATTVRSGNRQLSMTLPGPAIQQQTAGEPSGADGDLGPSLGIQLEDFWSLPELNFKLDVTTSYDAIKPAYGRFQGTNRPVIVGGNDLDPNCGSLDAKAPLQLGGQNFRISGWGAFCDGDTSTSQNNVIPGLNFDIDQPGNGVQAGINGNVLYERLSATSDYTSWRGILGLGAPLAQNGNFLLTGEALLGGHVADSKSQGIFQSNAFVGGFQTTSTQTIDDTSVGVGYRGEVTFSPNGPSVPDTGLQTISISGYGMVYYTNVDATDRFFSTQGAAVLGDVRLSISETEFTTSYGIESSVRFGLGGGVALTLGGFYKFEEMPFVDLDFAGPSQIEFDRTNYGGFTGSITIPLGTAGVVQSDARLKRDIAHLITLENGLKLYSFKYLWGDTDLVGVMAQDLLKDDSRKDAVVVMPNGFYGVDYQSLGIRMITMGQWRAKGAAAVTRPGTPISRN